MLIMSEFLLQFLYVGLESWNAGSFMGELGLQTINLSVFKFELRLRELHTALCTFNNNGWTNFFVLFDELVSKLFLTAQALYF
jgi:hypothetical protein